MIPQAYITGWQQFAPWQHPDMVEQDLVVCRALTELYAHEEVSTHLAFRGGTALYKLCLVPAPRYSEDLDLVQVDAEPIGQTLDRVHAILDPWLGKPAYQARAHSFRLVYRFVSEAGNPLRLKVEINTREHVGDLHLVEMPFSVESRWFAGHAQITTFSLSELLGTKLRALYQRKKGRDLFDLDYALRNSDVQAEDIVSTFVRYISADGLRVSTSEFQANLDAKCSDVGFCRDTIPLLRPNITFDAQSAATAVAQSLIRLIDAAWEQLQSAY